MLLVAGVGLWGFGSATMYHHFALGILHCLSLAACSVHTLSLHQCVLALVACRLFWGMRGSTVKRCKQTNLLALCAPVLRTWHGSVLFCCCEPPAVLCGCFC